MTTILARAYRHAMTASPHAPLNIFDAFLGDRILEGRADRQALLTADGAVTYGDVFEASGRFARLMLDAGVRPGDRVLIALPDGASYVAALFGTLRLGAVVVMVNPHLPTEQVEYFFRYTEPRVAFVAPESEPSFRVAAANVPGAPVPTVVATPEHDDDLAAADHDVPVHPTGSRDPAVFLFSGGTTGHPKGVVQTHGSFLNTTVLYGQRTLGIGPDDVTLSVPKLYFGYATGTNLFFPFSVGATTALFPERCTPDALFDAIERYRPTVLVNVPTMVNHLVSHPDAGSRDLTSLRIATSAGEALPAELHRRWDDLFGVPLLDGLGTAEMWHIFISNRPDDVKPGTLGRVVDGFEVRACAADGTPVPVGEVGTMRVRGDSLALGYWRDDEKTAAAFQGGWFVSGDMISFDADGYVTYAGRSDDMLKVSGKWLSPKELENCLLEHDSVREAAVVGVHTPDGLVKPSAFVVAEAGLTPDDALGRELQEWAKGRLEPYKYPRSVHFVDDLPRTHLGKVDRGRLARGDVAAPAADGPTERAEISDQGADDPTGRGGIGPGDAR